MTPKGDALEESTAIIREIETDMEESLQRRREELERELEQRLRREREETERKLSMIEKEFEKEKGNLREYHGAVAEYESARDGLERQLREHLDRSAGFQREIERLTTMTVEELRAVTELSGRLADLRLSAEERINEIRSKLKERFNLGPKAPRETAPAEIPAPVPVAIPAERPAPEPAARPDGFFAPAAPAADHEEGEFVFDLEKELGKLKRIKEMLDRDGSGAGDPPRTPVQANAVPLPAEPGLPPDPEEIEWPVPARAQAEPSADFKMPEINQFIQDFVQREHGLTEDGPTARTAAADEYRMPGGEETDFQSIFSLLERYRRSEPTDYSGEISFFQNRDHLILDGESLLRAVTTVTAEARKLFARLGQAGTPKDQFFIKQELINNQEVLRKIILRSVRMCERESCRLPRYTEDILNPGVMKDLLERLNMDNWSNQDDFAAFEAAAVRLKDVFHRRITPPAKYLRSIVQELEG
jgi:hypothetical protein